jgi:hypothetical protein
MNRTKEILDQLAAQNAHWHSTARKALANYSLLKTKPLGELEGYFVALCRTEKYDKNLKVRRRIIQLLPDIRLINILDVTRMPCQLARMISIRLCPRDDKTWGPHMVYFEDFTDE